MSKAKPATEPEPKAAPAHAGRPVLVTTSHRGVFFGYLNVDQAGPDTLTLERCRNVLYWGQSVKGFLGLAASGPDKSCRIGPAADKTELRGITSVSDCSADAVEQFERGHWSS